MSVPDMLGDLVRDAEEVKVNLLPVLETDGEPEAEEGAEVVGNNESVLEGERVVLEVEV